MKIASASVGICQKNWFWKKLYEKPEKQYSGYIDLQKESRGCLDE